MQNLGVCYTLLPLLKGREGTEAPFLTGHLKYFSTHPYLAPAVMGSVVKMEEEKEGAEEISKVKDAFMGPYAALGDQFFGDRWLPFSGLTGAGLALMGFIWAPVLFGLLFLPVQIWLRWRGFFEGYRRGKNGFTYLQGLNLSEHANTIRRWIIITCILVILLWSRFLSADQDLFDLPTIAFYGLGLAICLATFLLKHFGISPAFTLYVMLAVICFIYV